MQYHKEEITKPKDLAKLIKNTKCVIIKFSAKWCGPCQNKEFKLNYEKLKLFYKQYDYINFIELDLDDDDEIISNTNYYDFKVKSIPHFKICYEGSIVDEFTGSSNLEDINNFLKVVVKNS